MKIHDVSIHLPVLSLPKDGGQSKPHNMGTNIIIFYQRREVFGKKAEVKERFFQEFRREDNS